MSLAQNSCLINSSLKLPFAKLPKPSVTKTSFQKHGKSKVPSMFNGQQSRHCSFRSNHGRTRSLYSDVRDLTSLNHPLERDIQVVEPCKDENQAGGGIGIVKFFQGKNIFITGGTGLVGKVMIEKLLRSTAVGKIYVLIKAQDKQAATDRLHKEITGSELFKVIRELQGDGYEKFIQEKLIPVVGNICEENLGMDSESAQAIIQDVDVIVGSAASTDLNDRYDVLLETNVNASERSMRFAKRIKNLKLFVHISTAYVNGGKEGLILEKPLNMGETGKDEVDDHNINGSPRLDIAKEKALAMEACASSSQVTKDLKRLGQERAYYFGWGNAYQMTKAMGEMVLNEMRGDTPLLIIRPAVIEGSHTEPFPGWIQGYRVFDPIIISHGKGQLPAYLADPNTHTNIIPVDMVVNSTIAAIAKHGVIDKPQLNVYLVGSGVANPLRYGDFFEIIYEYFKTTPLFIANNIKKVECFDNFEDFSKYTRDEILRLHNIGTGKSVDITDKKYRVKVAYAEQMCKIYEFAGFFKGRFCTDHTIKLFGEMSKDERINFNFDITKIDWRKYLIDAHIPGLKKHVML